MNRFLQRERSNISYDIRSLMSARSLELMIVDTLIVLAIWQIINFLAYINIESLEMEGTFAFYKLVAIYVIIMFNRFLLSMYNSVIRYADAKLYLKLLCGDMASGVIYTVIGKWIFYPIYLGFSYTVLTIMMITIVTMASRLVYQIIYAYRSTQSDNKSIRDMFFGDNKAMHKINVAIVGAGNVGASLAAELVRNPKSHYTPVMFIDKDIRKIGSGINGIRIYPEDENIVHIIKSLPIKEIIIALPDASPEDRKRLYDLYKQTNCKVKLYDYPLGDNSSDPNFDSGKRKLREFRIEDLLFRDTLKVKSDQARAFYRDKVVLVTGGGGSIGSELCRQIAKLQPKKLVILDIYENNAYDIEQELIRKYGNKMDLEVVIASVRDAKRLDEIFSEIRPEIVFHAAAHKHVPLMEHSSCEAIKNNVFGTYNMANVAEKYGVKKFLLISTDKAVNPTNIMGASKRLCEMVIQCRKDSATEFTAVRFGNVLGSNGSVIPLFKRQIEAGGPITLTDKRIIRYFMTIPEAVGLVMETCAMAKNGELFVLDMGKPVRILDLAENMIRLSGMKPYEDIDIVEIGLRPGEKLYEELLIKTEELDKTENDMIFIERDVALERKEVEEKLAILSKAIESDGRSAEYNDIVLQAIKDTVPTYHRPEEVNKKAEKSEEMKTVNG